MAGCVAFAVDSDVETTGLGVRVTAAEMEVPGGFISAVSPITTAVELPTLMTNDDEAEEPSESIVLRPKGTPDSTMASEDCVRIELMKLVVLDMVKIA